MIINRYYKTKRYYLFNMVDNFVEWKHTKKINKSIEKNIRSLSYITLLNVLKYPNRFIILYKDRKLIAYGCLALGSVLFILPVPLGIPFISYGLFLLGYSYKSLKHQIIYKISKYRNTYI